MATLRGSLRVGLRQGFGVTASSLILGDLVENQPANEGRECHVTVGGDLSARIFLSATDRTPPARYASSAQPAAATTRVAPKHPDAGAKPPWAFSGACF